MRWLAKDKAQWYRWFAWHPVRIGCQWVWLETVERRKGETFCGTYTEHR